MKCPHCHKGIKSSAKVCNHCGTKLNRKSDKMAKRMTMNNHIAMACGGLLILISVVAFIYGGGLWSGLVLLLGVALMVIGKMMR